MNFNVAIMKKESRCFFLPFLLVAFLVVSCRGAGEQPRRSTDEPATLYIAAAANLSYVMPRLVEAFREEVSEYGMLDIRLTRASSGSLTAQIRNSAPFDLFLAANTFYPQLLYNESLTVGPPLVYARGVPIMVYQSGVDGQKGVECLTDASVEKIAIAQPELAPYGEAAVEILSRAGVLQQVESKFVYGTSVTQTFQHVITAADAGFIAASLLYGDGGRELEKAGLEWIGFPPEAYNPAVLCQAMVLLDSSNSAAAAFFRFMQGERAGEILEKNGYRVE